MKLFHERFSSHPLQISLTELWAAIDQVRLPKATNTEDQGLAEQNQAGRAALARFIWITSLITKAIKKSDATTWTPSSLSVAHGAIEHLKSGLSSFASSLNVAHLEAAGDTALDQFRTGCVLRVVAPTPGSEAAFGDFTKVAESSVRSMEEADLEIKAAAQTILESRDSFAKEITKLAQEFKEFQALFEAQKARVDELIVSHQQSFQTAQTERSTLFAQEVEQRRDSFKSWIENGTERLESLISKSQAAAELNLLEMEKHKARAKEILGVVASSGVSGHYQQTARREFWSAEALRLIALICFAVMGILIYHVVQSLTAPEFRWEMGLFRVGVGMALLVPAYYCAKESTKHRESEKRNRRLQIELATIEPFLEKLNDDAAMQAILKEKANSYFMGQLSKEPTDDSESIANARELRRRENQVMELLKTIASSVRR